MIGIQIKSNISKKRKLLVSESGSDKDSDMGLSSEETPYHIPDTQQPSPSKEIDNIMSDGELDSEDDGILKELKFVL